MEEAWSREIDRPWSVEPCFTRLLMQDKSCNSQPRFHRPDVWHTINLGTGKQFVSSAFSVIQKALEGRSIGVRFQTLSADYNQFCKERRLHKYISKFDERLFKISGNDEPDGAWNKASVTANMALLLEHVCQKYAERIAGLNDERTQFIEAWLNALCMRTFKRRRVRCSGVCSQGLEPVHALDLQWRCLSQACDCARSCEMWAALPEGIWFPCMCFAEATPEQVSDHPETAQL